MIRLKYILIIIGPTILLGSIYLYQHSLGIIKLQGLAMIFALVGIVLLLRGIFWEK